MRRLALVGALAAASCAHPPPVGSPAPIQQVVLGAALPGVVKVCIEAPHVNSHFDTPVTRHGDPACVSLDALRHWIAGQRAADE